MSLVNSPEFVTLVESSGSDSITANEGNVDVGSLLVASKAYYIEVVEGPTGVSDEHVGHRFEVDVAGTIDGGTGDGITKLNMASPTNTVLSLPDIAGYRMELRAHITLAEAFPKEPLFASFDYGLADQVQVFTGSSFSAVYLLGSNGEGDLKAWANFGGTIVLDDLPILPGQGLLYKRSSQAPANTDLIMSGKVRANPFFQRLDPGFNFVAEAFPVTGTFTTRDALPNSFVPSFDIGLADQVQVFNGSSFTTYFLAGDANLHAWLLTTDFNTDQTNSAIFDYKRSVFVKKSNATTNYRVPLGWTP
jgi:hypothetical protein